MIVMPVYVLDSSNEEETEQSIMLGLLIGLAPDANITAPSRTYQVKAVYSHVLRVYRNLGQPKRSLRRVESDVIEGT